MLNDYPNSARCDTKLNGLRQSARADGNLRAKRPLPPPGPAPETTPSHDEILLRALDLAHDLARIKPLLPPKLVDAVDELRLAVSHCLDAHELALRAEVQRRVHPATPDLFRLSELPKTHALYTDPHSPFFGYKHIPWYPDDYPSDHPARSATYSFRDRYYAPCLRSLSTAPASPQFAKLFPNPQPPAHAYPDTPPLKHPPLTTPPLIPILPTTPKPSALNSLPFLWRD